MLIEFSVANFMSIRHKQTLSLQAAPVVSKDQEVDERNKFTAPTGIDLLKSVAIYGPNGSGKSNLVKAISRMLHFIDKSLQDEELVRRFSYFELDAECSKKPIHFEIIFIINGSRYRYGFEITEERVSAEWLFGPANKSEVEYFTRLDDRIKINKTRFKEGSEVPSGKTKSSTLFLNIVHAFNGLIAGEVKQFLRSSVIVASGTNDSLFKSATLKFMEDEGYRSRIVAFMRSADLGIEGIEHVSIEEVASSDDPVRRSPNQTEGKKPSKMLGTIRNVKNVETGSTPYMFDFEQFESEGTKKFFAYSGPIIDSIDSGMTLIIDELDARLHPALTRQIVQLFNSNKTNPNNAQLIFVTHDINLLDSDLLRRDQIYFTEKNIDGETELFSLINIGGVRNDASYERDYMKGKYGALPYLEKFNVAPNEQDQKNR